MTKTIFITGSTDGIGKLAAIRLAKEGHHILLHGRSQDKLDQCITEVIQKSGNQNVQGYLADFSNMDQIREMATKVTTDGHTINVLINNAGVFKSSILTNAEGIDLRITVNYLAPYLLTKLLLTTMPQEENTRIINLSSAAQAPVSLSAIRGEEHPSVQSTYAQSKLALTMWSFDLAQKIQPTVIAVNPGSLLNTRMVKEAYGHHWSEADKGAEILHQLAVSPIYAKSNGKYFDNDQGQFGKAHPDAYNGAKIEALITTTESLIS